MKQLGWSTVHTIGLARFGKQTAHLATDQTGGSDDDIHALAQMHCLLPARVGRTGRGNTGRSS